MDTRRTELVNAVIALNTATVLLREFTAKSIADRELRLATEAVVEDPDGDRDA